MRHYDLIVIGGGIAGAATSYFAARLGASVLLLEGSDLNLAASGSNAGSIHAQIPFEPFVTLGSSWARRYASTIPLFMASIRRWTEMEKELQVSLGVSTQGGLIVAANDRDMDRLEAKAEIERSAGLPVEMWSRSQLADRTPYLSPDLVGALFCPIEGKADPLRATYAFALKAKEAGADILARSKVVAIEGSQGNFTVRTTAARFACSRIVNAAGSAAADVGRMVNLDLKVTAEPIQVTVTEKVLYTLPYLLYFTGDKLTLKQSADGGFLIGGGWPATIDEKGFPQVLPESMSRNLAIAQKVMPGLANVDVVRSWSAIVNGTEDWRPILGEAPGVAGFFLNLFPYMGFTAAPAVSEAVACMALDVAPTLDLTSFALQHQTVN